MSKVKDWQDGWPKIVARAWTDKKFKAALMKNPAKALAGAGLDLPPDCDIDINDGGKRHHLTLALPKAPADLGDHNIADHALSVRPFKCAC